MTLLYLALGYMAGIALGRLAWDAGLIGCATPAWLWLAPLAAIPLTPLVNRLQRLSPDAPPFRWPVSAGFEPPRPSITPALGITMLLCALAGALHYAAQPLTPCWTLADLANHNLPADSAFDQEAPQVTVEGFVSDYPLIENTRQRLQITVDTMLVDDVAQPVQGVLRLTTGIRRHYEYGQPVRVRGRLVTPPDFDTFSYREYLARKGVHSLMYSAQIKVNAGPPRGAWLARQLFALRARGEALLNRTLPEPYAALANGILLGIDAGIPDDLYDKFNLTGTSHVIVISGSNVAIIVAALLAFFQRMLGSRRAIYPTLVGIGCYALLVGGDAAVMRAAAMGGIVVLAAALNRRGTALVSLAAACWAITLVNPLMVWDVGFQLSSIATASLILFTPAITAQFGKLLPGLHGGALTTALAATAPLDGPGMQARNMAGGLLHGLITDALIVTLAANILVLPLIVYYFARLSLVSVLTNLAIAPVQPLILLWGTLGVLAGMTGIPALAPLFLWVAWLGLYWTVVAVEWSASLPGASVEITTFGATGLVAVYALIFGLRQRRHLAEATHRMFQRLRDFELNGVVQPALIGIFSVVMLLVWAAALSQPDGRLHVTFLDIGQGDGILIQTPSGRQVLIDGGSEPQRLFAELGKVMPFWDRKIDMVALTHPDGDHMNAQIETPLRFAIDYGVETEISQQNPDADPWRRAMTNHDAAVQIQRTGGWIDLGDGVALWVLWPPPGGFQAESVDNENSLVLKLIYGDFSVLLTGDAGLTSEAAWMQSKLPLTATVLKVGHHGSSHSTGKDLVAAVDPQIAVIQVGADNKYGHPTDEVLDILRGRLVLRNDQQGAIQIVSDGRQMWVMQETGSQQLE